MRQDYDQKMYVYVCMYVRIDSVFARRSENQVCVYMLWYVCMYVAEFHHEFVGRVFCGSEFHAGGRLAGIEELQKAKSR